jgi:isochorismate synthase
MMINFVINFLRDGQPSARACRSLRGGGIAGRALGAAAGGKSMSKLSERHDTLLSSYAQDTSFFFASPRGALLASEAGEPLDAASAQSADRTMEVLQRAAQRGGAHASERAIVAGALPFAAAGAPSLRLHTALQRSSALKGQRTQRDSDVYAITGTSKVQMQPTPAAYMQAVAKAVQTIKAGALKKVVLARVLDLELRLPLDLSVLLRRLAEQNHNKYIFSCDLSPLFAAASGRRVLLGASPELLIEKRGTDVLSHPLAGSLPRSDDQAEDMLRAQRLSVSAKNRAEHACVVEAVADVLSPFCRELHVPAEPALVQTAAMWHLGTRVVGRLRDPALSSLALARALHPTPAVCGEPREQAAHLIEALEGFSRDYFAGTVGYCDARGDGEWAVTIRCAEARERSLRLYAGAGIVQDSVPSDELEETTAKLNTMLRAMGIEHLRQVI